MKYQIQRDGMPQRTVDATDADDARKTYDREFGIVHCGRPFAVSPVNIVQPPTAPAVRALQPVQEPADVAAVPVTPRPPLLAAMPKVVPTKKAAKIERLRGDGSPAKADKSPEQKL